MNRIGILSFLSALFFILLISIGNIITAEEPSGLPAEPPASEEAPPLAAVEATIQPPSEVTEPLLPAEATIPLPPAESTAPLPHIEFTAPLPASEGTFFIQMPVVKKATSVGMDRCRQCHTGSSVQWDNTIHAKWKPGFVKAAKIKDAKKIECETCHGPGSLHVEDTRNRLYIISFGPKSKDTRTAQNAVCLTCHEKEALYYWKGTTHGRNLSCTDCHHVMDNLSGRGLLNDTSERDICLKCHVRQKKDIFRSPHLSHDSKMTCSTCHAPHGSDTPGMLTSSSVNENCSKCHAEKRGPYLFDHLPVQENCLLCHEAHSSANRTLLKMRQPFLCLECHSNLPVSGAGMPDAHDVLNPTSRYAYNKGCTNCHPMIHGSRHPSGARLQR